MGYQYHIECAVMNKNKKRRTKLVIVYILILLLVLVLASSLGITLAKYVKYKKSKKIELGPENKQYAKSIPIIENSIVNEDSGIKEETINSISTEKEINSFISSVSKIYNEKKGKRVFLTFDDGPSKAVTPHILDTLKKYNVKATFFVLGSRVKVNEDLLKREYMEGHYIANHGYSHKYSKIYSSPSETLKEYNKTEKQIQKALNKSDYSSHLFRFPGGSVGGIYHKMKKQIKQELKKEKIAYLDWNALTYDADGANTKEKILKNLKKTVGNHDNVVVLMHDAPDKILTYETLDEVINYLKNKGYDFKNMYDLM